MAEDTRDKIPTHFLPKTWRKMGAQKFECSEKTIENVVYGISDNLEIFEYMVTLAEQTKAARATKKLELAERLKALQQ